MMKIVFYSLILNNHQANIADELWELTNYQYCFVELANLGDEHRKGDSRDYKRCPYLLRAWESKEAFNKAMNLALTAECCVFSGVQALPFQKARMKKGLLSFEMSERWLKKGWINLFSPAIFKMSSAYHWGGWKYKPLYKLCCSGFAAEDSNKLGIYKNKCFKWGYFTAVSDNESVGSLPDVCMKIMWCSRYIALKHPELPLLMADSLRRKGYRFILNMYGEGELKHYCMQLSKKLGLDDCVKFMDNLPNPELLAEMRRHSIFLFTSDRNEGWGAVANESMANGCLLVASDGIGSTPYLLEDGITGLSFRSPKTSSGIDNPDTVALADLCKKVEWLFNNREQMRKMIHNSIMKIRQEYSPKIAAVRLLKLIENLSVGKDTPYEYGPCSKD